MGLGEKAGGPPTFSFAATFWLDDVFQEELRRLHQQELRLPDAKAVAIVKVSGLIS